eukprot:1527229-Prymnesium_polylepis.1
MPPSIRSAYDALVSGHTAEDLANAFGIQLSTSWSYIARAAQHVPAQDLRVVVQQLVPPELWQTLLRLRGNKRLGGSLNELWDVVQKQLPPRSALRQDDNAISALRLARMAIVGG